MAHLFGDNNLGDGVFGSGDTNINPTPILEASFSCFPNATTQNYSDITSRCRGLTTQRGRNYEYDRMNAGTMTETDDNRDAALNPTNTSSPYYPLLPQIRKRLSLYWDGLSAHAFGGISTTYPQDLSQFGFDSTVAQDSSDWFLALNIADIPAGTTYVQEMSDVRVRHVLQSIGIDDTLHYIGTGSILLAADPNAGGQSALSYLLDVDATENGLFFCGKEGLLHFTGHLSLLQSYLTTPSITFGPSAREIPYALSSPLTYDSAMLYNSISVTPSSGNVQTAASLATGDFIRSYALSLTKMASDSDALTRAKYELALVPQVGLRVPALTINGARDPSNIWPSILSLEYGDRVKFHYMPVKNECPEFTKTMMVGQIGWKIEPGNNLTTLTLQLIPADPTVYWYAGIAGASEAGTTTYAAPV